MARIFCAQPTDGYDWLFRTLRAPLQDRGHSFVTRAADADVLFFEARGGPQPFDDSNLQAACARQLPTVVFDYHDYSACGNIVKSQWLDWQARNFPFNEDPHLWAQPGFRWLKSLLHYRMVRLYFMKNVQASQPYPSWVLPIDYGWRPEWEQPEDSYEQFRDRPFDICFVGMTSPPRATALCDLIQSGLFKIDWEWYRIRYSWSDWLARHRRAKLFLEADGNSLPFRPQQLAWVAAMLKQKSDYRWAHEWRHAIDCVKFGDFRGVPSGADLDAIARRLESPRELYDIYRAGRQTLRDHFSEAAVANYIADAMRDQGVG